MNLVELGKALEERRQELGISRAEVARRLNVTTNYVWTIERARLRKNGKPSQPSRAVLEHWLVILAWDDVSHQRQIMKLAGHVDPKEVAKGAVLLLGGRGFNWPRRSFVEEEALLEEIQTLLFSDALSAEQRAEVLQLLKSIVSWLRFTYVRGK